jgi:hypothetical protein
VGIYRTMTTPHKTTIAGRENLQLDRSQAPLSPQWAFVVQLRQGTPLIANWMQGRIEHICSGHATTFTSLEEVRAFMEHMLAEIEAEKPP